MFDTLSHILWLEPASQPQNLRAELQKLERVTPRSKWHKKSYRTAMCAICSLWHLSNVLTKSYHLHSQEAPDPMQHQYD